MLFLREKELKILLSIFGLTIISIILIVYTSRNQKITTLSSSQKIDAISNLTIGQSVSFEKDLINIREGINFNVNEANKVKGIIREFHTLFINPFSLAESIFKLTLIQSVELNGRELEKLPNTTSKGIILSIKLGAEDYLPKGNHSILYRYSLEGATYIRGDNNSTCFFYPSVKLPKADVSLIEVIFEDTNESKILLDPYVELDQIEMGPHKPVESGKGPILQRPAQDRSRAKIVYDPNINAMIVKTASGLKSKESLIVEGCFK